MRQVARLSSPLRRLAHIVVGMACPVVGVLTLSTSAPAASVSTWSIVPSPNGSSLFFNQLQGVACASVTSCVAVGTYSDGTVDRTLAESWNGSSWTKDTTVDPSVATGAPDQSLSSVACTSPTSCIA